jgi:hypothetical protein
MNGIFGRFVFPLLTYAVVGTAVGGTGLRKGIRSLVGLGAPARLAAFATTLVAMAAAGIAAGVVSMIVCVVAHGAADPPLGADLFASAWIGLLGGATYGAYFSAGSAIGKAGSGRGIFLGVDFIIGGGAGVGALLTPRGHVQSLLGGTLCADLSQRASSALLVVLALVYLALAVLLSRRPA